MVYKSRAGSYLLNLTHQVVLKHSQRMLNFYFDIVDRLVSRVEYNMLEMDTYPGFYVL